MVSNAIKVKCGRHQGTEDTRIATGSNRGKPYERLFALSLDKIFVRFNSIRLVSKQGSRTQLFPPAHGSREDPCIKLHLVGGIELKLS